MSGIKSAQAAPVLGTPACLSGQKTPAKAAAAMGYLRANQRPACGNCKHAMRYLPQDRSGA